MISEVSMGGRKFIREFKLEAVKLMTERGMGATQWPRIGPNVISRWVREAKADRQQAFPGARMTKPGGQRWRVCAVSWPR